MTDRHNLRDQIARALAEVRSEFEKHEPISEWTYWSYESRTLFLTQADAVLAVIDVGEVRAEALRDLARVLQESLPESPSAAQTDRMKFAIGFLNASAGDPYDREEEQ